MPVVGFWQLWLLCLHMPQHLWTWSDCLGNFGSFRIKIHCLMELEWGSKFVRLCWDNIFTVSTEYIEITICSPTINPNKICSVGTNNIGIIHRRTQSHCGYRWRFSRERGMQWAEWRQRISIGERDIVVRSHDIGFRSSDVNWKEFCPLCFSKWTDGRKANANT